jgi:Fe-Mn family superoxide dismutase
MNNDMLSWISVLESKDPSKVELEPLRYSTGDLDPVLSKDNVEYHYNVLSQGYVDRFNNREGDPSFNLGGAKLHNLFWQQLKAPYGSNSPTGFVKDLIEDRYKTYANFQEELAVEAMKIQGSGWVYLAKSGDIKTTANQTFKSDIIMPIDMWEHSFMDYVPSKNAKKKYIKAMFKIMDWQIINDRFNSR